MLANLNRELPVKAPWVTSLVRNRLDVQIPAYMVSLTVHALFLVILALAGHHVQKVVQRELQGQMVDTALTSSESTFQDLDQSSEPPSAMPAAGSFAPTLASTITSMPSSSGAMPVTATDPNQAAHSLTGVHPA